jgi:thiamine-monophosphate kinase
MTAPDHLPQKPAARQPPHSGENRICQDSGGPDGSNAEPPQPPPQPPTAQTLADLGEWELIRRLGAFAPPGQFADDAALLAGAAPGQGSLVVNTDVLVEGIHFSDATTGPADVGWRAAAANLSDLAAMGAMEVVGITVGLVAPPSTPWSWVEGVYGGLAEALRTYGGVLLGGDCSGGDQRILAVTAIGRLPVPPAVARSPQAREERPIEAGSAPWGAIRRGDGRPGDALLCTGPHGLSRLGLALLQGPDSENHWMGTWIDPALAQRAIAAHRRPLPRFDALPSLIASRPEGACWRVGGCDSSDGLAAAVRAITAASGCAARLDRARLPLEPATAALPQAEAWCLGGGEDFELVLTLEPGWAAALVAALPGSSLIGELVAGVPGALGWSDGTPWPSEAPGVSGYRHFS